MAPLPTLCRVTNSVIDADATDLVGRSNSITALRPEPTSISGAPPWAYDELGSKAVATVQARRVEVPSA